MIEKNILVERESLVYEQHPFHLVDPSPWPLFTSICLWSFMLSFVTYYQSYFLGNFSFILGIFALVWTLFRWFYDIIAEATYEGHHTKKVQKNILLGMHLFIASEIMFFFGFFWSFFHFSLAPGIMIGGVWPPAGLEPLDTKLAFANTMLLLGSGACITWAHIALVSGLRMESMESLFLTCLFGSLFIDLQRFEYDNSTFSITDGSFGSVFYMLTGFHGLHVIIGTLFLYICLFRHHEYHFQKKHHVGFICAIWYWHFVDVVWIFLFVCIYIWGI